MDQYVLLRCQKWNVVQMGSPVFRLGQSAHLSRDHFELLYPFRGLRTSMDDFVEGLNAFLCSLLEPRERRFLRGGTDLP